MNGYPRILAPSQVNYRNNSFGPQNTTPIKGGRIPPPNNSTINRSGFSQYIPNTPTKKPYSN